MEYGPTADQNGSEPSGTVQNRKRARVEGEREVRQPGVRHCGNCGKARHNARTCQADEEGSSESEASTQFIMSSSDADDNGDEVETYNLFLRYGMLDAIRSLGLDLVIRGGTRRNKSASSGLAVSSNE
ncbi:hypothetical protein CC80DRAFT_591072 [Byssothecium circinans]|uniref:CCHC-type domain-containing protein n=1 Tax=Byssothecium circinans TaxID=147558 RepID=A0A6A5U5H3_9PLEO|nr:hypothetical protein CC80DRAFT_591072 [Byssothecium circinans]